MRFASVCSGIESATVAFAPLGWEPVFYSEIAAFPNAVLAHHYPHVPNFGDMLGYKGWPNANFDVLVGGTPCQSFSVAGFREGLSDPRGNLALVYLEILRRYRPRGFIWENVPGVLSSGEGRDFGSLLGGVAQLGYGYAWRTLDAQFFGIPQRRRRVFLVGYLGSWARAAAVLFDPESLQGHLATRGKKRADHSGTVTASARRSSAGEHDSGQLIYNAEGSDGFTLTCSNLTKTVNNQTPLIVPFDRAQLTHAENRSRPMPGDPCPTVASTAQPCVAYLPKVATTLSAGGAPNSNAPGRRKEDDTNLVAYNIYPSTGQGADLEAHPTDVAMACTTIDARQQDRGTRLLTASGVRRLTPLECERLQGFPDGYTAIPFRGSIVAADSPRYEAIGNAIAIPPLRWIAERFGIVAAL